MHGILQWFRSLRLRYFSHPAHERALYRYVHKHHPQTIVEIGMSDGERAYTLLEFATSQDEELEIRYTGIDWFEAKNPQSGWSLKKAHQELKSSGARVRLFPGDPAAVLAQQANGLAKTDLIIIDSEIDSETEQRAWQYLPRMLHEQTAVFVVESAVDAEDDDEPESVLRQLSADELRLRAGSKVSHIARAA